MEFKLGRIKCPLALRDYKIMTCSAERIAQRFFSRIPTLDCATEFFRSRREFDDDIGKAHVFIDCVKQIDEMLCLGLDLLFCAENMRIVLRHLAHAHQTV